MSDTVTVTTNTSWFSRLGTAFRGVVMGLVIALAGLALLFWNEGRSVNAIRTNQEGAASVSAVSANSINPANEGRLIHITASAVAEGTRSDTATGISANALVLTRKVEYFQWQESSKQESRTKLGGGEETVTTYSYDRQWSDFPYDSSHFHQPAGHQNPAPTIEKAEFRADRGKAGAFIIDQAVMNSLSAEQPLTLSAQQAEAAAKTMSRRVSLSNGGLYIGENPAEPKVGDMRVTYVTMPQAISLSIIGAQTSGTIQPWPSKTGSPILMVRTGVASADQMFAQAKSANQTMSWVLRGLGFVVVIAGFRLFLGPLGVLGDVVPFIGSIIRMGTGFIATAVGLALGTITISIAWLFYRPVLALVLVAIVGGGVYAMLWWRKKRAGAAPAVVEASAQAPAPAVTAPILLPPADSAAEA